MKIEIKNYYFYVVATVFYMLYSSVGSIRLAVQARSNVLILIFVAAVVCIQTARGYNNFQNVLKYVFGFLIIGVMYQLFVTVRNTPYPFLSQIILLSTTFFPVSLLEGIRRRNKNNEAKIVITAICMILLYLFVNTAIEVSDNASIVHMATKVNYMNADSAEEISNVLTFDLSYGAIPLVILCVYSISKVNKVISKVALVVASIFIVSVMFMAEYTSTILILIVLLCFYYVIRHKKSGIWLLLVLLIPFLWFLIPNFLEWIANSVESNNMRVRLNEVVLMLRRGDFTGYNLSSRLGMYLDGIRAFLRSPIWGNSYLDINPHSTFIQYAADIGLIGLIPFLLMLQKSRRIATRGLSQEGITVVNACYWSVIVTGMINPIVAIPTMMIIVWLLVPLCVRIFETR